MVSMGRRYFISKEGYLGLGLGGASQEYLVVILFGLDMPFVLGPVGNGYYRIIGHLWYYG